MSKRLPSNVYYTRRNGGMYVSWDGTPEGPVSYTYSRDIAWNPELTRDDDGYEWETTPFQGADGRCYTNRVIRLAAKYAA